MSIASLSAVRLRRACHPSCYRATTSKSSTTTSLSKLKGRNTVQTNVGYESDVEALCKKSATVPRTETLKFRCYFSKPVSYPRNRVEASGDPLEGFDIPRPFGLLTENVDEVVVGYLGSLPGMGQDDRAFELIDCLKDIHV